MDLRNQIETDARDLKGFGYAQELLREMGGFSSFAISFSVISILTGAIQLYGYGLQHGGPLQMTLGWIVVSIFTLTVALSMAELASAYPTSGALYHWSHFLGGRTMGWFTACFNLIGQFAILAGIDYGLSQFVLGLTGLPNTTVNSFGFYFLFLFSHALFNHIGIRLVSRLNNLSAWYHIIVVVLIIGVLCWKGFAQPPSFLLHFHHTDGFSPAYSFLVGLLLAQWTLTGYDASAHVTEETVDPRRRAPWGIFLAVALSIVAGFFMLAVITLSIPDLDQATGFGDNALIEIFKLRLGSMGVFFVGLIAGAIWLCGLAAMTSASRMVYAFSRDGGLPFSKVWSRISPRYKTPSNAIWGLSLLATVLAFSVKLYSAVVSIATIALYISYGLPILARLIFQQRTGEKVQGPWNLGRWSTVIATIAVIWVGFITVIFVLPPNDQAGWVMLTCACILVVLWVFIARARFSGPAQGLLTERKVHESKSNVGSGKMGMRPIRQDA